MKSQLWDVVLDGNSLKRGLWKWSIWTAPVTLVTSTLNRSTIHPGNCPAEFSPTSGKNGGVLRGVTLWDPLDILDDVS